jgi:hypothetical protein
MEARREEGRERVENVRVIAKPGKKKQDMAFPAPVYVVQSGIADIDDPFRRARLRFRLRAFRPEASRRKRERRS